MNVMRFCKILKAYLSDGSFNYSKEEGCRCEGTVRATDGLSSGTVKSFPQI